MKSSEEVLFPAGGSMVFPGNSSKGHYVPFYLLAGVLWLPGVISTIHVTKVEFHASLVTKAIAVTAERSGLAT